jgi:hypothetical protein
MKNTITSTNPTFRAGPLVATLAALILVAAGSSSARAGGGDVLAPASLPYGLSYQEWSAKWWQWSLGQSTNHFELVGESGSCDGPASRVRFLAGAYGFGINLITNEVTVSAETPLFLAVLSFVADNTACPITDFTSLTADQLTTVAVGAWKADATLTTCTIDGVPVAGLDSPTNSAYNVVAPAFSYTTAEHGNMLGVIEGEYCIPGGMTIYPAVADGVYLMLSPLPPGKHTIHFVGVAGPVGAPFVRDDVTYDITVRRDSDHEGR